MSNFCFTGRSLPLLLKSVFKKMAQAYPQKFRVLDLGCGDGVMLADLQTADFLNDSILLAGVDIANSKQNDAGQFCFSVCLYRFKI